MMIQLNLSILFVGIATTILLARGQKRAPKDEYGLGKTIFSSTFTHWNESLRKAKIIPDILSSEVPQPLTVVYFDDNVDFGTLLEYHRVDIHPVDLDWIPKEGVYYTVVMSDPDYPDPKRPVKKEYLHWMVTNMEDAFIKDGNNVAQYVPPFHFNGTCKGIHREVYVVYEQPKGKIEVDPALYTPPDDLEYPETRPFNRENFSSKAFVEKYNLKPLAANYFTFNMDFVE